MDAHFEPPPPPYSVEDVVQSQHLHQNQNAPPPHFKVHRKPVPEVNNGQRIRYQRSNQELRSPSQTNYPSNLRHQRSFQDIHFAVERETPLLNQQHGLYQNVQPPFESHHSQPFQCQRPLRESLISSQSQRTHPPSIHHQGLHPNHGVPPFTSYSPRPQHQSSSQETFTPLDSSTNTPKIRYQPPYQDIRVDSRPDMKHLRSFRGQAGGDAEPDKELRNETMDNATLPPRPGLSLRTTMPPRFTESQMYASPQSSGIGTPQSVGPSSSTNSLPSSAASSPYSEAVPSSASASTSTVAKSNAVQDAFREVRHFAGGLISHPYETTKHFTLLRHSHGLVFFQGPSTSLAISIFSDGPLPPDRTLWLQNKGFSGKTGMRLKALMGANGSWLNVTPTMPIEPEQLNPSDERAWQRDITQFRKKAKPKKIREKHKLRETVVLRIPAEAGDGYFSVVLCTGDKKKNLCTSPTFRLLSTSTSMHSIKGASLSTLPLELGAMAVNVYATSKIAAVAGPVASVVQNRVQKYMPSTITTAVVKGAGTKAYDMAGSNEKLQKYMPSEATRDAVKKASTKAYDMAGGKEKVHAQVEEKFRTVVSDGNTLYEQQLEHSHMPSNNTDIALDAGPQPPYPIRFTCTSDPLPDGETSLPTTTLSGVPDHITNQLYGHYFAWIRPQSKDEDWQPSLISALPPDPTQLSRANFALANKRLLTLRLIDGYAEPLPPSTKLTILVLGFLRPDEPLQRANLKRGIEAGDEAAEEAAMFAEMNDVAIAQGVLDHPAWEAEVVVEGLKGGLKKGYADVRMGLQRGVDKVPLYKLGVRMEGDKMREKGLTVGGFYVLR